MVTKTLTKPGTQAPLFAVTEIDMADQVVCLEIRVGAIAPFADALMKAEVPAGKRKTRFAAGMQLHVANAVLKKLEKLEDHPELPEAFIADTRAPDDDEVAVA